MSEVTAYLGLGSNLGDRRRHLEGAVDDLRGIAHIVALSDVIETAPQGPPGQGPYLNAAAGIVTPVRPRPLLEALHAIEARHGRDRRRERRRGPRTLDLDLLLYGDLVLDEPGITVPHPRMHERLFVLEPLARIAPGAVHPGLGVTVAQLRDRLGGLDAEYGPKIECCW